MDRDSPYLCLFVVYATQHNIIEAHPYCVRISSSWFSSVHWLCVISTFEVPLAFLLFNKSCKQSIWHKTQDGMRIKLGFGIDCLLLPKTGMPVVPPLAMLATSPLAKDWIKGGALHFT